MNNARLEAIERGLGGIQKKVLDATPIMDSWTVAEVAREVTRVTGATMQLNVVEGVLRQLVEKNVVKALPYGKFRRVSGRPKLVAANGSAHDHVEDEAQEEAAVTPQAPTQEPVTQTADDPLALMSSTARGARDLAAKMTALADEIERAALMYEARIEQANKDGEKLRQLQALLRSI